MFRLINKAKKIKAPSNSLLKTYKKNEMLVIQKIILKKVKKQTFEGLTFEISQVRSSLMP